MVTDKYSHPHTLSPTVDNFVDVLMTHAVTRKDALAYGFLKSGEVLDTTYTFGQLDQRVRAVAGKLQEMDLAGVRAVLLYPSGLDYVVAFLACLYARVVAVPVFPPQMSRQIARIESIVKDSQAQIFLTNRDVRTNVEKHLPEMSGLAAGNWILTDEIPETYADTWKKPELSGKTLAFLQYTSGSTGTPKGVMVSHFNLISNQKVLRELMETNNQTVHVSWLPLFHDMGLIGVVLHSLFLGTPAYLMAPIAFLQKPIRWLKAITAYGGTNSGAPDFAFALCAHRATSEETAQLDLSTWEMAFNGAEPVRKETLQKFQSVFESGKLRPGAQHPVYGMAEATLMISGGKNDLPPFIEYVDAEELERHQVVFVPDSDPHAKPIISCGHTASKHTIKIVHPDTFQTCNHGQIGEIWFSGPSVTQGYWKRPKATKETFAAYTSDTNEGPFLRTGDLGFLKEQELFITGRLKDLIIIRGSNYYPQDIEYTVENCHPGLRPHGGVAFSVEESGEERLVVVQELAGGLFSSINLETVFNTIREAVAESHGLQVYTIILTPRRSIPKTSSGKIMRQACKKAFLAQQLKTVAIKVLPLDSAMDAVCKPKERLTEEDIRTFIFQWIHHRVNVALDKIDASDTITAYGADSLMMAEFETQISDFVGFKWPILDMLILDPSIEEISRKGAELVLSHLE